MRYNRNRSTSATARTIYAKYAGKCYGCGGDIKVGAMCDYLPGKGIGHLGAFSGDGDRMGACYSERVKQRDAGFVDLDRAYEDQCSDICGR